jgi:hypothetical protein
MRGVLVGAGDYCSWRGRPAAPPRGSMLGLVEAVLYEKAGGAPIPGYSDIAAMKIAGQG